MTPIPIKEKISSPKQKSSTKETISHPNGVIQIPYQNGY